MVKAAQVVFVRLTPNFFLVLPTPIHTIYLENEVIVECLERSGLMDHPKGCIFLHGFEKLPGGTFEKLPKEFTRKSIIKRYFFDSIRNHCCENHVER